MEVALNAIRRRYAQIYSLKDRLLIKPDMIGVTLRKFMILIKSEVVFLVCVLLIGIRARPFLGEVYCDSCVPASEPARSPSGREIRPGQGCTWEGSSWSAETDCTRRSTVGTWKRGAKKAR